jgi:hypothetical protein
MRALSVLVLRCLSIYHDLLVMRDWILQSVHLAFQIHYASDLLSVVLTLIS